MFKFTVLLFVCVAGAVAIPSGLAPVAYNAPLVAPGVVTARSSQVIARTYNGIASPYVAAAPLAYTAPAAAAVSHHVAYSAPAVRAAAPFRYTAAFL